MGRRMIVILLAGIALAASTLACSVDLGDWGFRTVVGNGDLVEDTREVSDFSAVALAAWGRLHVEVGDTEGLTIVADRNLLDYIETHVVGGELEIRHRRRTLLRPSRTIDYYLKVTDLEAVRLSGTGTVDVPEIGGSRFAVYISGAGSIEIEELDVERLVVEITGAGNVDVGALAADRLDVRMSGAGDLAVLEGVVRDQEIGISGGGNYQARGLQSERTEVRLSGLGNATVSVSERLEVQISGAGSVRYVGDPTVEKSISGVGNVQRIGS